MKKDKKVKITPEIDVEVERILNILSEKSKLACAICGTEFEAIENNMRLNHTRLIVVSAEYKHPRHKSKKIKVCGPCMKRWIYVR